MQQSCGRLIVCEVGNWILRIIADVEAERLLGHGRNGELHRQRAGGEAGRQTDRRGDERAVTRAEAEAGSHLPMSQCRRSGSGAPLTFGNPTAISSSWVRSAAETAAVSSGSADDRSVSQSSQRENGGSV